MDIRATLASRAYQTQQARPDPESGGSAAGAVQDFARELRRAETSATGALTGGADPQALVESLAETKLAVETAVAVRDKVVEAYQEILRMPI